MPYCPTSCSLFCPVVYLFITNVVTCESRLTVNITWDLSRGLGLVITIYRKQRCDSSPRCAVCLVCVSSAYRLLQGVAATQVFELRVRAGSLASISASGLARKLLLHAAIWHRHRRTRKRHTVTNTHKAKQK